MAAGVTQNNTVLYYQKTKPCTLNPQPRDHVNRAVQGVSLLVGSSCQMSLHLQHLENLDFCKPNRLGLSSTDPRFWRGIPPESRTCLCEDASEASPPRPTSTDNSKAWTPKGLIFIGVHLAYPKGYGEIPYDELSYRFWRSLGMLDSWTLRLTARKGAKP